MVKSVLSIGFTALAIAAFVGLAASQPPPLPQHLAADAAAIISLANSMNMSGWNRLADWVDLHGARLSGSDQLEKALDYALAAMQHDGFDNVHQEIVNVTQWIRGQETLKMVSPYNKTLNFLSIGSSVGTGGVAVVAPVLVVSSFDELTERKSEAVGKIVVFDYACDWAALGGLACYEKSAGYRSVGANAAAAAGAVAVLVRSLTQYSLGTPHTGMAHAVTPIPAACITTEDSDFFARMAARNISVVLSLSMEAHNFPPVPSRNIVAEITGSQFPDQIVMFGGHTDSWDVGQGAQDDGAGFMVSYEALYLIKKLGLRPARTIRLVGWVCEEFGGIGAQQYFQAHKDEVANMSAAFEADLGVFRPLGLEFTGSPPAVAIMQQIMQLAEPLNATQVIAGGSNVDSGPWGQAGVPFGAPMIANQDYFQFHHTYADMMSHVPQDSFEQTAAVWAIATYAIASLPDLLPR